MWNVFEKKAAIDFEKCVKPHKHMPFFAKMFIANINKILNIPLHVRLASMLVVVGLNVYQVKEIKK
jgi:hypothetical protein